MREKLLDLMKNEGLKSSQLAEMLGINPAGISHILAGRNKPGFDLLQKILRRFPQINPDWLLLDSSKMYRDDAEIVSNSSSTKPTFSRPNSATAGSLFDAVSNTQSSSQENPQQTIHAGARESVLSQAQLASDLRSVGKITVKQVVIFYDDSTFESFTPKRD